MSMGRWAREAVTAGPMALAAVLCAALAGPAAAQIRPVARPDDLAIPSPEEAVVPVAAPPPAPAEPEEPRLGPVTNLPLPRYVSLKTDEGNARRGPSLDQRIDWVFVREDMPLRITAEFDNWRRVEDRDGLGGWVHYTLLSGARTVIVEEDMTPMRARADEAAPEVARLRSNLVARLDACTPGWCRLSAGGYRGWVAKGALWGVDADEVLD